MKKDKKVKRKINIKGALFLILVIYLIGALGYFLLTRPIKNIIIEGNNYVSTSEILELSGLNAYPSYFSVSKSSVTKKLKENEFIESVDIKKSVFGKIVVTIVENKPLFINALTDKVVFSNGSTRDNDGTIIGIPTLINYVPSDIYDDLVKGLAKIDSAIISVISEIEYDPDISNDIVFDEARFLLKMNDKNIVYINTPNIMKLNNYNKIYAEVGGNGILLLDSNSQNYIFNSKKE